MQTPGIGVEGISWRGRQKRLVEDMVIRFAKRAPGLGKSALTAWARLDRHLRSNRRWFAGELATALDHKVRVRARLVNGMRMDVIWNDFIGAEIYYHGCYEPASVDLVTTLLSPGMVFLDIGAHVGQYTILASGRVTEEGQVHSFEPTPHTFQLLSGNVGMNKLRNVRLNSIALSQTGGAQTLYLSDAMHDGFNSLRPPYQCDSGRTCEVTCMTLDHYLKMNRVPRVDLIKMDVEGAECEVLNGAGALLGGENPPLILLEFNPGALGAFGRSCEELRQLLTSNGYDLFVVEEHALERYTPRPREHSVFNVLAAPHSRTMASLARLSSRWKLVE
jgi:FkbM family methyltransferase